MKKLLLSTLVFCLLSSLSYAQTGGDAKPELGTIINGNGYRPPTNDFFPDCDESIPFTILVANLNLFSPNQDSCQNCVLPSGYPPMGLSINISEPNISTYYSIPDGSFRHSFTTPSGVQIFESTVWVPLDFSESCINSQGLTFSTMWDATLLIDDPVPTQVYPICSYIGAEDIFDCNVFDFEVLCPVPNCLNDDYAQKSGQFEIFCTTCCRSVECNPACSEEELSIASFCDFNDDLPCDPCTGNISGNALTLCVVNEDYVRLYDLGLNAAADEWTINGVAQSGGTCITINSFDPALTYDVCASITFWLQDGSTCEEVVCTTLGGCSQARNQSPFNTTTDHSIFEVYPNPVKESLKISNGYNEQIFIHLISIDGKTVATSSIPSFENGILRTQDLPAGLYYMQIKSPKNELLHTERIAVTR